MKVLSRTFLGLGSYFTYPHTNPFAAQGQTLVYSQVREGLLELYQRELATGKTAFLKEVGPVKEVRVTNLDVAMEAPRLAMVFKNSAWILDLDHPKQWQCVYQSPASVKLDSLCSITSDGSRMVCMEMGHGPNRGLEIDLGTGEARTLFTQDWHANHIHYCHYDPAWVAFSHGTPAEETPDRCWVWHAEKAPKGRAVFDQASEEPGKFLYVGHERWGYHDLSGYVIAYAVSPAGKRGLYEVFADGRPARLLWESDVLWHCNMDPSGRYAVVDTTGPFRDEPLTPEEFRHYRDLHVQTDLEMGRNDSEVAVIDLQTRESLLVATVQRHRHPYHPHPHLSPDGKWIIWNESSLDRSGGWIAELSLS